MSKIQIDEVCIERAKQGGLEGVFSNATVKYLAPCMVIYGDDFKFWSNNVYKVGIGIGDIIVDRCGLKFEKHIFYLLDSSKLTSYFKGFISWIRKQSFFEDDYVYGNIQTSTLHMVVIKFPPEYYHVFDPFTKGLYSKMYTPEEINILFSDFPNTKRVLIKDHNYKVKFVGRVNKLYGTTLTSEDWTDKELDFPPEPNKNVFNNHINDII